MSPHTNRLSLVVISLKTFPSTPLNFSFSSVDLPTCGAYTDTIFKTLLPTVTLSTIILSVIRFTSITLSIHFSATKIPTPASPSSHPAHKNLYIAPSLPSDFALPPFHLVSCKQQKSSLLLAAMSATSPLLPLILPTFTVPILKFMSPALLPNVRLVLGCVRSTVAIRILASGSPANAPLVSPRDRRCGMVSLLLSLILVLWRVFLRRMPFLTQPIVIGYWT